MPFVEVASTQALRASLGLPDELDPKHPYHYTFLQHSDGDAMLVTRSYSHLSESFVTEVLVTRDRKFLVEHLIACKETKDSWAYTLTGIRLFAESDDQQSMRGQLMSFLQDLLDAFPSGENYPRVSEHVALEVRDVRPVTREIVAGLFRIEPPAPRHGAAGDA